MATVMAYLQGLQRRLQPDPVQDRVGEVMLAIQLHQNPNAIIPPGGGGVAALLARMSLSRPWAICPSSTPLTRQARRS